MKPIRRQDQFKARLKAKGLKATSQRLAVHEAMTELVHASADSVCEWINARAETKITPASVYNALSQMTDIGIYRRRLSADSKMYFDVDPSSGVHMYDIVGGEYRDLSDPELTEMVEAHFKNKKFRGYKIEGIDIQIVCHPTRRKKNL